MNKPRLERYSKFPWKDYTDSYGNNSELTLVRATYVHNGRRFVVEMTISPDFERDSLVPLEDILMMEAERFLESEGITV